MVRPPPQPSHGPAIVNLLILYNPHFKGQRKPPPASQSSDDSSPPITNAISLHSPPPSLRSSPSSMSSSPPPTLFILLFSPVLLLFSGPLPATLSSPVTFFPDCDRTFSCGDLRNITYPFAGGDRPEYCGLPGFQLTCRDGYAELNMSSLIYRVLRIDPTGKTLTLSRLDLWNNTCPSPSHLVNSTLDSPVFNYGEGNEDLNLFYDCDNVMTTVKPSNQFYCNVSGNSGYAYYLTGAVPSDPILNIVKCTISLRIPVLESAADSLTANATTLGEVLTLGFNVNYSNPYDAMCSLCIASAGQCGYDFDKEESICICSNRICHVSGIRAFAPWILLFLFSDFSCGL